MSDGNLRDPLQRSLDDLQQAFTGFVPVGVRLGQGLGLAFRVRVTIEGSDEFEVRFNQTKVNKSMLHNINAACEDAGGEWTRGLRVSDCATMQRQ